MWWTAFPRLAYAVTGVRRMVTPTAGQVYLHLPWPPRAVVGASLCPKAEQPLGSIASPLKACTVSKGEVLLLYPNCCALGRWVVALSCVWSWFSAGSSDCVNVNIPFKLERNPYPILSWACSLFREKLPSAHDRCPKSQGLWEEFCVRAQFYPDLSLGETVR